ncbi:MAG: M15 family metallopeptidase [Mycobacterium sp.]
MAFRTVNGSTHSENGWPLVDRAGCDNSPIPGTDVRVPLQAGLANTVLKAFMAALNEHIESVYNARGGTDEGGYTESNSVLGGYGRNNGSNHLGGTAFDYNWSDHAFRVSYDGWSQEEIALVRELLDFFEGLVFWGQDWNSPKDGMHFQMGYNTYGDEDRIRDFIARKIRADGKSTFRAGPKDPNDFPLPAGYFYGPLDGPTESVSGEWDGTPQAWKDGLGRWQAALGLPVSKVWDNATAAAATALQKDKGWKPLNVVVNDVRVNLHGCVLRGEWDAVIREGWRLLPPAPPAKEFPHDYTDRELLLDIATRVRYIEMQLSPGHPDWESYGKTLRDKVFGL